MSNIYQEVQKVINLKDFRDINIQGNIQCNLGAQGVTH